MTDDIQKTRRANLQAFLDEQGGATRVAHGFKLTKSTKSYFSQLLAGYSFGERSARNLEKRLRLPPGFLDRPVYESPSAQAEAVLYDGVPSQYEQVRRVEFKLSAGVNGFELSFLNGDAPPLYFRKDWLAKRHLDPSCLFAVGVHGASMEPGLHDGDVVIVDVSRSDPEDGAVFAVNYEGECVIKRLIRDDGQWWLVSDNADQRRFPRKRVHEQAFIIGRVVHKQSEHI